MVGKENTGFAFKLSYTSEENTLDLAQYYTSFLKHNDLGKILFPFTESNNIQKSINLVYMPGLSTANTAKFTISLGNYIVHITVHVSCSDMCNQSNVCSFYKYVCVCVCVCACARVCMCV